MARSDAARPDGSPLAREGRWFLELLTMTSFVVAQPILDVFGRSPETFIFRGAGRPGIVLFALLVILVPAVGVWAVVATTGAFGLRVRRAAQLVAIWLLLGLLGIQVLKKLTPLPGVGLVAAGAAIGAGLAWVLRRPGGVRRWLAWASPAAAAFLALFLFVSPVSGLILPQEVGRAAVRADRTPVVMVIFDQLPLATLIDPEGRIDRDRFPHLAGLADDGTWYRNYSVTEAYTGYSVPTILTGRLVRDRSKSALATHFPDNLFTLLGRTHRMEVFEYIGQMCPPALCAAGGGESDGETGEGGGLPVLIAEAAGVWSDLSLPGQVTRDIEAQFEEPVAAGPQPPGEQPEETTREEAKAHFRQHRRPIRFTRFLESLRPGRRPGLHFVHVLLPHFPWRLFPSGIEYERPGEAGALPVKPESHPARWRRKDWQMQLTRQRHVLQTQFADALVGDLVDRLQDTGMYDESLIVVTSDHGHSFGPGRLRQSPYEENLHEVLWVPLVVKRPHQDEGEIEDANIAAPDLLPTLADALDVEVPWRTDGVSALGGQADRGPVKRFVRHRDGRRVPWPTSTLSISLQEGWRRLMREAIAPASRRGDPRLLPYRVGPGGGLVGERIEDLSVGSHSTLRVEMDRPGALDGVDPESGVLPALISGSVPGAPADATVAVVLNGRVAGVSPTYPLGDDPHHFAVLAPDFFFRKGSNELRVFLVEGDVLRRIG